MNEELSQDTINKLFELFSSQVEKGHETGSLYLVIGAIMAVSPAIIRILKRWINRQKNEIKEEVTKEISVNNNKTLELIHEQAKLTHEVAESIKTRVEDHELRIKKIETS